MKTSTQMNSAKIILIPSLVSVTGARGIVKKKIIRRQKAGGRDRQFWMDMSILRKGSGDGLYATLCPVAVDYLDYIYKPEAPKTVLG